MKVLVINQPFIKDFCRCQRWPARTRARALRMPDWLCYATAVLEKSSIDVELYDFVAADWDKNKLRELIKEKQPDFVVFDATTPSIYSDIDCGKICKEVSKTKVIMVGTHVSALPEETLNIAQGNVDIIAIGEYDYTIRDIVQKWPNLNEVDGIAFIENGVVKLTKKRTLIENLDELPFPSRQNINIKKYLDAGHLYPYINIIGGRGCPFQCTFCQWPQLMFGHKYRLRSAKNIVDEMEYDLKLYPKLKYGEFYFEDDTFTLNKERAYSICEEIRRRKLRITWSINARPDLIDLELFKVMKKSGCRQFLVGFESGDQGILDKIKKGIKIEDSRKFVDVANKAGIILHGCFVLGLPGETKETAQKTMDFALSLKLNTLQFAAAVPLPGTVMFDYCKENGLLKAKSWNDWLDGGEQGAVVDYPGLNIQEINKMVDVGLRKFYLKPGLFLRFIFHNRNHYDIYRKIRGGINFLSYLLNK